MSGEQAEVGKKKPHFFWPLNLLPGLTHICYSASYLWLCEQHQEAKFIYFYPQIYMTITFETIMQSKNIFFLIFFCKLRTFFYVLVSA